MGIVTNIGENVSKAPPVILRVIRKITSKRNVIIGDALPKNQVICKTGNRFLYMKYLERD